VTTKIVVDTAMHQDEKAGSTESANEATNGKKVSRKRGDMIDERGVRTRKSENMTTAKEVENIAVVREAKMRRFQMEKERRPILGG